MKKKQTILCSNDENINKLISTLANKKVFNQLLEVLRSIGTFDTKIEIFKDESNLDDEKIKVWCFDQNNNIFVFAYFQMLSKTSLKFLKKEMMESLFTMTFLYQKIIH